MLPCFLFDKLSSLNKTDIFSFNMHWYLVLNICSYLFIPFEKIKLGYKELPMVARFDTPIINNSIDTYTSRVQHLSIISRCSDFHSYI